MKTLGLLLATSLAVAIPLYADAAGCQYDMQCKAERICQKGQCVAPDSGDQDSDQPTQSAPATETSPRPGRPHYCCTASGKLGPYRNPGPNGVTLNVGDACQATLPSGRPVRGTECN
ncbi:hypothetical protein CS8_009900 [Cupriavidus sp. 8B]